MRITERQLRRIIKEELLSEADLKQWSISKDRPKIGKYAVIDPASTVGNSTIGIDNENDDTEVQGDSNVINSIVFGSCKINNSDLDNTYVRGSKILSSKVIGATVEASAASSSRIILTANHPRPLEIFACNIENSTIKDSDAKGSTIKGNAGIIRSRVENCVLNATDVYDTVDVKNVKGLGGSIRSTVKGTETASSVSNVTMEWIDIVDSKVKGGTFKCTQNGGAYIELADITGNPTITGAPQIVGLTDGETKQYAVITGTPKISGAAQISGKVSGDAEVSGNAEVHGQAHITGTCKVSGTAKMIRGTFNSGEYTEGSHDATIPEPSLTDRVMGAFGL